MKQQLIILFTIAFFSLAAQPFNGTLGLRYVEEGGFPHTAQISVNDSCFYIAVTAGGNGKHSAYLLNTRSGQLYCFIEGTSKVVKMPMKLVVKMYEENKLREGFAANTSQTYAVGNSSKEVNGLRLQHKTAAGKGVAYQVWEAPLAVNMTELLPLLRLAGLWNEVQDGNQVILEATRTNTSTQKSAAITVTAEKKKLPATTFSVPEKTEVIDLEKLIAGESKKPDFPALLQAFAGF